MTVGPIVGNAATGPGVVSSRPSGPGSSVGTNPTAYCSTAKSGVSKGVGIGLTSGAITVGTQAATAKNVTVNPPANLVLTAF